MEYAIFPLKNIGISQRYSDGHRALDIYGANTGTEEWFAPCTVKVLAIQRYNDVNRTGFRNNVYFGTCDANGNKTAVMCEDGISRVLTFACTHMDGAKKLDVANRKLVDNTTDWFAYYGLTVGKVFSSGQACYREGFAGLEVSNTNHGNHVHMDVGLDWQYEKVEVSPEVWHLNNLVRPASEGGGPYIANTFHRLKDWNVDVNLNGYTFAEVNSRIMNDGPVNPNTGIYLQGVLGGFNIRPNSNGTGTALTTVPKGSKAAILGFEPGFILGSDGKYYQWAKVQYGTKTGYAQLDLHLDYKIVCDPTFDSIYLRAVAGKPCNVRTSKVNGQVIGQVAPGSRIELIAISSSPESDEYQWARVNYNGQVGFVQIDTVGYNQLEF